MARSGTARADSGSSPTRLIHAVFDSLRTLYWRRICFASRFHRPAWETEFCRQRLAGGFRRRARENGWNSVRRPRRGSLTYRNCEGFYRPGNQVGLPRLDGGGRSPDEPVCVPANSRWQRKESGIFRVSALLRVALAEIVPLFRTLVQHFPLYENREFLVNETGICEH